MFLLNDEGALKLEVKYITIEVMPDRSSPTLLFISKFDLFSKRVLETIEKTGISVVFATPQEVSLSFFTNANFDYILVNAYSKEELLEYFLSKNIFLDLLDYSYKNEIKTLFLLPLIVEEKVCAFLQSRIEDISKNNPASGFLVISDPVYKDKEAFTREGNRITLPEKTSDISMAYEEDVIKSIVRNIFSLKAYGHIQTLLGFVYTSRELATICEDKGIDVLFTDKVYKKVNHVGDITQLQINVNDILPKHIKSEITRNGVYSEEKKESHPFRFAEENSNNYFVFGNNEVKEKRQELKKEVGIYTKKEKRNRKNYFKLFKEKSNNTIKKNVRKNIQKKLFTFFTLFFSALLLPYLLSFTSILFALFSINQLEKGQFGYEPINNFVNWYANKSEYLSEWYLTINGTKALYSDSLGLSRIALRISSSQKNYQTITKNLNDFFQRTSSKEGLSIKTYASDLTLSFDAVYRELGFSLSEFDSLTWTKPVMVKFFKTPAIQENRKNALLYKTIVQEIPQIFGEEKTVTYAVVLQNDRIVRATGGKIEGVAIVTINRGAIENIEIIETANNQNSISGEVSPPYAISRYLKKDNWTLTDSNWDYSYPISAEKIIWFIDKEFDRKVDGVVSISKSSVEDMIKNENKEVPKNVSELLSKGISSLTGLLKDANSRKNLEQLLLSKKLLLYIPNPLVQDSFTSLGWDDSFKYQLCEGNCYTDAFSIIESNFGEEQISVRREAQMTVSFEEGILKRKLTYYIQNNSDTEYLSYIRLVVPKESGFSPITLISSQEKKTVDGEVFGNREEKENGIYVVVPKKQTIGIEYAWESSSSLNLGSEGYYNLFIQKQPGIPEYPIELNVTIPVKDTFLLTSPEFLTKGTRLDYNTVLARDFNSRILWKQK